MHNWATESNLVCRTPENWDIRSCVIACKRVYLHGQADTNEYIYHEKIFAGCCMKEISFYQTAIICNDNDWTSSGEILRPWMSLTLRWPVPKHARSRRRHIYYRVVRDLRLNYGRLLLAVFNMQLYNYATCPQRL